MMTTDCPCCGSTHTTMCDQEIKGSSLHVYMDCGTCYATWTGVWEWAEDIEIEEPDGEDTTEADDINQRAADMNATLRDIGGGL